MKNCVIMINSRKTSLPSRKSSKNVLRWSVTLNIQRNYVADSRKWNRGWKLCKKSINSWHSNSQERKCVSIKLSINRSLWLGPAVVSLRPKRTWSLLRTPLPLCLIGSIRLRWLYSRLRICGRCSKANMWRWRRSLRSWNRKQEKRGLQRVMLSLIMEA